MPSLDLLELRHTFERARILLAFNGPVSQGIIEEMGRAVRAHLENHAVAKHALADVFSVYIEQTQNIHHYARRQAASTEAFTQLSHATILIGQQPTEIPAYQVMSANLIAEQDLPQLTAWIDEINTLDAKALRALYKQKLRQPLAKEAKGAGLGLIEMRRRACQPLSYRIQDTENAEYKFFSLSVSVSAS